MSDGVDIDLKIEMLSTLQSQLERACSEGHESLHLGSIRKDVQINVSDPCAALETVTKQIDALQQGEREMKK